MAVPILYIPNFVSNPDEVFKTLRSELEWVQRDSTPRSEYYTNLFPVPYTYGKGAGRREYQPQPVHPLIEKLRSDLKAETSVDLEVCFLNLYKNSREHLGWHADDSPEMDDARPIAIISLGGEREIWFAPQNDLKDITKKTLNHGSLTLMLPGMQDSHFHRIPKAGFESGERISLTYRGFVSD